MHKPIRKATFKVVKKGNKREFIPVNKRAKRFARALGGRVNARLSANDLRTIAANGAKVYNTADLKPITL